MKYFRITRIRLMKYLMFDLAVRPALVLRDNFYKQKSDLYQLLKSFVAKYLAKIKQASEKH